MFVLLSGARCGSNLIRYAINQHPSIACCGEMFNTTKRWSKVMPNSEMLLGYVQRRKAPCQGFTVLHSHLQKPYSDLWGLIKAKRFKVVHLNRRDLLSRYVSYEIALQTRVWVSQKPISSSMSLTINVAAMLKDFERTVFWYSRFRSKGEFAILYENLVEQFPSVMGALQEYLEVEVVDMCPRTYKLQNRSMCEVITNYDEVVDAIQKSKWKFVAEEFEKCWTG